MRLHYFVSVPVVTRNGVPVSIDLMAQPVVRELAGLEIKHGVPFEWHLLHMLGGL